MPDIDFLRSTTTTVTDREADGDYSTHVTHLARFAVNPGAVPDVLTDYSTTVELAPHWLEAEWRNGKLTKVTLSGPQRLKSGGLSEKQTRHRRWQVWGFSDSSSLDRDQLPAEVRDRIAVYERAIAGQSHGSTSL